MENLSDSMWVKTTPGDEEGDDDVLLNLVRSTQPRSKYHHLKIIELRALFITIMRETRSARWASVKVSDVPTRFLRVSDRRASKIHFLR